MSWFKEVRPDHFRGHGDFSPAGNGRAYKLIVSAVAVKLIWWSFRRWQRSRLTRNRAPSI